jgi:hypothetical protein
MVGLCINQCSKYDAFTYILPSKFRCRRPSPNLPDWNRNHEPELGTWRSLTRLTATTCIQTLRMNMKRLPDALLRLLLHCQIRALRLQLHPSSVGLLPTSRLLGIDQNPLNLSQTRALRFAVVKLLSIPLGRGFIRTDWPTLPETGLLLSRSLRAIRFPDKSR